MNPSIALTVDVEERHHGLLLTGDDPSIDEDIDWILNRFDEANVKATFFIVGELARRRPDLVRSISICGHEIGLHGITHEFLHNTRPETLERQIEYCVPLLEEISGKAVLGFRAPFFSLTSYTLWCLPILARQNFHYDASIYPGPNDRYGWPDGPSRPVLHAETGLVLFPVPLLHPRLPIAFSGGAYLRILPKKVVYWGFQRQLEAQEAGMIYMHPWEVTPKLDWDSRGTFRANLTRHMFRNRFRQRLTALLRSYSDHMGPVSEILANVNLPSWSDSNQPLEGGQ